MSTAPLKDEDLAAVRRPLAQASTLPPRCYSDEAFFAAEVDNIFRREWLSVGRVDQVARPGDYFSIDLLGEPLVVVRGKDDQIRVLSRVCRHRWMPVVEGAGNRKSFQCPYHLWTYGLDGRLLGAPEMQRAEGFALADCRLPALRTETWEGWIFVNFNPQAAPLAPQVEPLRKALAPYRLGDMRTTEPLVYDSRWNWKVLVDNFMESYHHAGPHAETLQSLVPAAGTYAEDSDGPYAILRNPAKDRTIPLAALKPIDGLTLEQQTEFIVCAVFPSHLFAVNADSMVYYQIEPHAVDRFTLRIFLCVPPESAGLPGVAGVRSFLDIIHQQDITACNGVQAGLGSRLTAAGRYSHLEKAVWQFARFVADRVRLER